MGQTAEEAQASLERRLRDPLGLLMPGEVAGLLRVDPKTVRRWCADGRLACISTPGRHRRVRAPAVLAIITGEASL